MPRKKTEQPQVGEPKKKRGRYADTPRKYNLPQKTMYDAAVLPILQNLSALGMTMSDIGSIFGYTGDPREFIRNLSRTHPEVKDALEHGRSMADINLVAQMYKAACGYSYDEVKEEYNADGTLKSRTVTTKFIKPEPQLAMFLAVNRMKDQFQSVHRIEVDRKSVNLTTNVDASADQIAELGGKLLEMAQERRTKPIECRVIEAKDEDKTMQDMSDTVSGNNESTVLQSEVQEDRLQPGEKEIHAEE